MLRHLRARKAPLPLCLLPRKQAFVRDVNGPANDFAPDATLPSPTQKKLKLVIRSLTWTQSAIEFPRS